MRNWLIDEWREAWRFSSIWVAGACFTLLTVWNLMPPAVRDVVPDGIELAIGLSLWGVVALARIVRQPGSQAKIDAKREASANG
jgi:hypothetical protein